MKSSNVYVNFYYGKEDIENIIKDIIKLKFKINHTFDQKNIKKDNNKIKLRDDL